MCLSCRNNDCGGKFHIHCLGVSLECYSDMNSNNELSSWQCQTCSSNLSKEMETLEVEQSGSTIRTTKEMLAGTSN